MLALVVDDNKPLLILQELLLQQLGIAVIPTGSAEEALAIAQKQRFDLAVLDYHLPCMNGAQLARQLRRDNPHIRIILMSGSGDFPLTDLEAADAFLIKGQYATHEFLKTVRRLLDKSA